MNARFVLAEDIVPVAGENTYATPRLIKLSKPQGSAAVTIHLDGTVKIDFSDVAGEKITLVHVGDRLVILFDNQSTVTLDPFYGPNGEPLQDISVHLGPDRDVSGIDFATLFPVTTDQSVLPAAGGNSPLSGANFAATPPVDALTTGQPLALLNGEGQGGANSGSSAGPDHVNHVPVAVEDTGFVVEAGVKPGNTPFAGLAVATGNVLANDTDADIGDIKLVIGVVAGTAATAAGQVGATLVGIYGQLSLAADGAWTYTLDNAKAATQALAQGAHGRDIFTYTMRDAAGETSTTTLTLDVLGTNDAPVIAAGATAIITEQAGQTQSELLHQVQGTLNFSDVDVPDSHTVGVLLASAQWSGGVAIPAPTLAQATAALVAAVASESAGGTGALDWRFGLRDADVDFLSAGETLVLAYQVTVTDDNLATSTQTVTITFTGTNDAPQIAAGVAAGVTEQVDTLGSETADSVAGTLIFTDVDLNDVGHTASVTAVASSGITAGLAPEAATLQGFLHIDSTTKAAGSDSGSVGWTFSAPDRTFDYLATGETLILTYTVQVDDHDGGTAADTVTITVTGRNDAPRIAGGVTADVAEHDDMTGTSKPDSVTGTLAFTDVDLDDVGHTASVTAVASSGIVTGLAPDPAALQSFLHVDSTAKVAGSDSGSVGWTFSAPDNTFDYLAAGEQLVLTYTVQVDDHDSGTADSTVTITVTGSNDAPQITTGVGAGVTEQDEVTGSSIADSVSGTLAFTDVDLSDVGHTASVTAVASSGVTSGLAPDPTTLQAFLHIDTTSKTAGSDTGSVGWTFAAPDSTFDYLAEGETLTLAYAVAVDDHDGGTGADSAAVTITITGSNDKVVITSAVATGVIVEDPSPPNLVANGDFESNLQNWTPSDPSAVYALPGSGPDHSAAVLLLTQSVTVSLTQSAISTAAGQHYTLGFWVQNLVGGTLDVIWNGSVAGTFVAATSSSQEYSIDVLGTGSPSQLSFSFGDPGRNEYFFIDNVSLREVVDPVHADTGGTINFSDPDLTDRHGASFAAENAGLHGDGTAYLGGFSLSPAIEANGSGSVAWHFEASRADLQFLAAGQTYQQLYDVTISDGHGGDVEQTVTVTITGTNDAPVIATGVTAGIAEQDSVAGSSGADSVTGTLAFTDVDLIDVGHTASVTGVASSGATAGLAPDPATLQSFLHIDSTIKASGSDAGSIGWTFAAPDSTFDYLAEGETLTLTYAVAVDDHDGGTGANGAAVTITITGSNDKVVITSAAATGAIVEDALSPNLVVNGDFAGNLQNWTASDPSAVYALAGSGPDHSAAVLLLTQSATVSLTQSSISTVAGQHYTLDFWVQNLVGGTLDVIWNGSVVGTFIDATPSFKEYSIDVLGTGNPSELSFGFGDSGRSEYLFIDNVSLRDVPASTGGIIDFSDPDLNDSHRAMFVAENGALHTNGTAYLGSFSLLPVTEANGSGSVQWHFAADRADLQFLSAGQTYQQFYDVTITDGHGGDVEQTVTVTITGTNDAPVIATGVTADVAEHADATGLSVADSVSGTLAFTDVDLNDVGHTASVTGVASSGVITGLVPDAAMLQSFLHIDTTTKAAGSDTGNIGWTFSAPDSTFDYLAEGETLTLTYAVAVDDHDGGAGGNSAAVTITVTGANDKVAITSASATGGIVEDPSPPNLVANGGFESNLDNWAASDADSLGQFPGFGHESANEAVFFADSAVVTLTQSSILTVAGQHYTLDFWVEDFTAGTLNVTWNGSVVGTYALTGTFSYQEYSIDVLGTGNPSELSFSVGGPSDFQEIALDDVSLFVPVDPVKAATSGSIAFSDADRSDTHSAVFVPENGALHSDGSAYLGSFSLSPVTEANGSGSVAWHFEANRADLQFLAAGQTYQQFYDVTIGDGHGGDVVQTVTVTLVGTNDAPVLEDFAATLPPVSADQTAPVGTTVASLLGNHVTDVDSGAVQGIAITGSDGYFFVGTWQFSTDGGANWTDFAGYSTTSALLLTATDLVRFAPSEGYEGSGTFSFVAWDQTFGTAGAITDASVGGGSTAFSVHGDTASITVTQINHAPVLEDDSATTNEDTTLTVTAGNGVLQNDYDPDTYSSLGDTISVTTGTVATAQGGSITFQADGGYTYTPGQDFNGQDSVVYTVQDSFGATATATLFLTVNPVNDAPVVTLASHTIVVDEDAAPFSVSYTVSPGPADEAGQHVAAPVSSIVDPSGVLAGYSVVNGAYSFTLKPNAYGTVTVSFTVTDDGGTAHGGHNTSATETFTISVNSVNDAPVAVDDHIGAEESTPLTVNAANGVLANDTDADVGDSRTVTTGTVATAHGSIVFQADGSYTYTPNHGFVGDDSVDYIVRDAAGATDTGTLFINVAAVNDPPVISGLADTSVAEDGIGVLIETFTVSDVDSPSGLTFRVLDASNAVDSRFVVVPASGTTAGQPGIYELRLAAGVSFNYQAENADGSPTVALKIEVNDHGNAHNLATAPITITVTHLNHAPVAHEDTLNFATGPQPDLTGWAPSANGHYYKVVAANLTWAQAESAAEAVGGYLATITSAAENSFILGLMSPNQAFFIGASDVQTEGTWKWVVGPEAGTVFWQGAGNGAAVGGAYSAWKAGEPNDTNGGEDFGTIQSASGGWNDVGATITSGYVMEYTLPPPVQRGILENASKTFSADLLLANDTDVDGDLLSILLVDPTSAKGATVSYDANTHQVTYNAATSSELAALTFGQSTTDTFTYTITDGHGGTSMATATITVVGKNDAPVIGAPGAGQVVEDFDLTAVQGERVTNGNFESRLTGWTTANVDPAYTGLVTANGSQAYAMYTHASTVPTTLTQTLQTTAGVTYDVRFLLDNANDSVNSVTVYWGGVAYLALQNLPASGSYDIFTPYSFRALATTASTVFQIAGVSPNTNLTFDNISVVAATSETTTGTIGFTDAELGDTHTVSASPHDTGYVGSFDARITNSATGDGVGQITWLFNVENSQIHYLAAGASVQQVYTVNIIDSSGNVSHQDVTVTIVGSNDAPVISTGAQTANITEDASSTGNLIVNPGFESGTGAAPATFPGWASTGGLLYHLTLLPNSGLYDASIVPGGLVTLSQTVATTAGVHYALDFALFNYATAMGTFSVSWVDSSNVSHALDSFSNRAVGTYNSSNGAYSYGHYAYDIVSNGPSVTVVFSLNGTTSNWQLDDVSLTREETASGTLSFTDVDLTDTHSVSVLANSNIGSFTATLGADTANGAPGAVNWNYAVDDAAIQYLGATDTLSQTWVVRVDDNHGGFTTQNVTVVTHGVNDAASISGTAAATVTEDGTTTVNGTLTVSDVDTGQNHFQAASPLAGTYGTFTFNAMTGAWGYTLNNTAANVQALSGTDVKHDTLMVTSLDGTASQTIDVTINGTNDAPVVTGETILLGGYGGAPASAGSTPLVAEVENNSSASPQLIDRTAFAIASNANLGDASLPSITITGSISTSADKDFFKIFLKAGETITLDVDNTMGGLDTFLALRPSPTGSSGTNNNNDSATTLGGTGSTSGKDSYLTFTASSSAFYYIDLECNTAGGASSSGGYQLQVSIGGFIPDPTGTSRISVADLLANDTDVDGDVLSITNVTGTGVSLVDGGTAVQVQAGVTSFTYTVSDGHVTRTATANVTQSATGYTIAGTSANELLIGSGSADVLSGGSGADTLDGGKGADTLTGGGGIDKFVFNPGDSALTVTGSGGSGVVSGYDTITDFTISNEKIDFAVAPIAPAVTTDFADSTLTAAGLTVTTHAIANGVITFKNGSTNLSLASMSDVAAVVQYLRGGDLGDAGATVAFTATLAGVTHTFLYQQVGTTPSSTDDLLVDLSNVNISNLAALIGAGNRIDPIVLDLGHDGIGFSSLENGVAFDINGDGVKAHMAWTSGNDGILAIDLDGSGKIENGSEIFSPGFAGGHFADGLAALATLDSNHDGRIDSADAAFAKLLVWQDFNHNGVSDAGELTTLTDHDIASILLNVTPGNSQIDGQAIAANGTFINADGTTGNFVEVAFDILDGGANGSLHFIDAVHLSDADFAGHGSITGLSFGDFADSVTLGDNANAMIGTGTLTIDGTAATSPTSALTVDGSGLGPSTHLNILGGAGNDSLTGGAGDDTIAGGKGNDTLKGGGGADIFAFADSGAGHLDTILDYNAGEGDKIDLSALLDGHLGAGANVSDFVRLANAGSNVVVQVDSDGAANGAKWSDVAVLQDYHAAGNQVLAQFEQQVHQLSVAA